MSKHVFYTIMDGDKFMSNDISKGILTEDIVKARQLEDLELEFAKEKLQNDNKLKVVKVTCNIEEV